MQAIVYLERPHYVPWLARGVAQRLGHATRGEEEAWGLAALKDACAAEKDMVTLRLQPRRLGVHALCDVEARARRAGFRLADPEGVTRTLLVDLKSSGDELLAALSAKTRRKLRARAGAPYEIRRIEGARHVDACKRAGLASLRRHGRNWSRAPWEPAFTLAASEPSRVAAFGLFAPGGEAPLAFVVAQRYGQLVEYFSAGSVDDPDLRKHPFNYWLLWSLMEWGRANGGRYMDLGGISDGGQGDALSGIASFKRHFSDEEVEVGREMIAVLNPAVEWAERALHRLGA